MEKQDINGSVLETLNGGLEQTPSSPNSEIIITPKTKFYIGVGQI